MFFKSKVKEPVYNTEGLNYEEAIEHINTEFNRWETEFDAENKKILNIIKILCGIVIVCNLAHFILLFV
ncbi:hypothetical protein [Priestia megaterium]|uniref:hypothetical protein n=1 Tax=Priestia megaterium TaxID=1404 RepID=UPI0032D8D853